MFQVPVTFQIYLAFKNTWEDWGYLTAKPALTVLN
jgi:hypothetical protein